MLAGLFPTIFKALELDISLKTIADSAHRFKVLQDRFRQAEKIKANDSIDALEENFMCSWIEWMMCTPPVLLFQTGI